MCRFVREFATRTPNIEEDSEGVQSFLTTTKAVLENHPVFANATEEELDCACEVYFSPHNLLQFGAILDISMRKTKFLSHHY